MRVQQSALLHTQADTDRQTGRQTEWLSAAAAAVAFLTFFTDPTNTLLPASEPWRPGPPVDCRCSSSSYWHVVGCPPLTWTLTTSCGGTAILAACSASPWSCTGSSNRRTRECKRRFSCLPVRAVPCAPRKHAENALKKKKDIKPYNSNVKAIQTGNGLFCVWERMLKVKFRTWNHVVSRTQV